MRVRAVSGTFCSTLYEGQPSRHADNLLSNPGRAGGIQTAFKVGNTVGSEGVHGQEDGNREVR
jgi:hypothetical protein